ncbi:MAG: TIGR03619 family F420-dependent LLM class oxidoreductase [Acidimicrobiales bacterium]
MAAAPSGEGDMAELELGAQLPAWQWSFDVGELRAWAQGAEALGYEWLGMPDHVFYAYDTDSRPKAHYPGGTVQHEALTFLAWVAACTSRAMLTTSVLVLPQRQAGLVAKQAAEVDVLSGGRLRLGVGVGWQEAEFDGLGKRFADRGRRVDEDIALLRACWREEPLSTATGAERLEQLSMLPKPAQPGGPPILYGGLHPAGIDRAARLCDGWIAMTRFRPEAAASLVAKVHDALARHGRDPAQFPLQATTPLTRDLDALASVLRAYAVAGFTRLGVHLPSFDPADQISVEDYLAQLETVRREVWPEVRAAAG